MRDIKSIVDKIDSLKPMPAVTDKLLSVKNDPQSSAADLSEVLKYDAAATANLLKLANSAFYSRPVKVDSVQQAIVYLGIDKVVDFVLMAASSETLKASQKGYGLDEGDLWKYSVASALIARQLAEKKAVAESHLIFTAALLKDIGKVILNQYVEEAFEPINTLVRDNGLTFREAEKEIIGIDHAELGGMVAEAWNFSPKLVEIIGHHHMPHRASISKTESSIVYLADTLCMMVGIGVGSDGLAYRFHQEIVDEMGLTSDDFLAVIAGFGEQLQEVERLVNSI